MPRILLFTSALMAVAATGLAQTRPSGSVQMTVFVSPPQMTIGSGALPGASADAVVVRVQSFDRNGDGMIAEAELPERMQHLVARGDTDGSGALDEAEIRALTERPMPMNVHRTFSSGGYGFADQFSTRSSSSHIEGAIKDLGLAGPMAEGALAISKAFVERLETTARADLLAELGEMLTAAQMTTFERALEARTTNTPVAFTIFVSEVQAAIAAGAVPAPAVVVDAKSPGSATRFIIVDQVSRTIDQFGLSPGDRDLARVAYERYKERLRPGEPERMALLEELKPLLDQEQRDDLRAALERRPVVALGASVMR